MTEVVETDLTWWDLLTRIGADHRPVVMASAHTGQVSEVVLASVAESRYQAARFALPPGADLDDRIPRVLLTQGVSWALVTELVDLQLLVEDALGMRPPMTGRPSRPEVPVAIEEALLIAETVRAGDPARLEGALEMVGWAGVPDWLKAFADGSSGQLVVSVLRPGRSGAAALETGRHLGSAGLRAGSAGVLQAVGTPSGWGLFLAAGAHQVRFEPVGALDLQATLNAVLQPVLCRAAA